MSIFLNPTFIVANFRSLIPLIDHPKNDENSLSAMFLEKETNPTTTIYTDLLEEESSSICSSNHTSIVFLCGLSQQTAFSSSASTTPNFNSFPSSNFSFNISSVPSSPFFSLTSSLYSFSSSPKDSSYMDLLKTTSIADLHLSPSKTNASNLESKLNVSRLTSDLEMEKLLSSTLNVNIEKPKEADLDVLNPNNNVEQEKEQLSSSFIKNTHLSMPSDRTIDIQDTKLTINAKENSSEVPIAFSTKSVEFQNHLNSFSLLSSLLKQNRNSLKGSHSVYLKYSHLGEVSPSNSLSISLTLSYGSTKHKLSFVINPSASVEQVIGYSMFLCYDMSVAVPFSFNVHGWNLYLMDEEEEEEEDLNIGKVVEDDEDSDDDFGLPPLNMNQPISNFGSNFFLLKPKLLLFIHSEIPSSPSMLTFAVDSTITLNSILHEVCQYLDIEEKSGFALYSAKNHQLVSTSATTTIAELNGNFELVFKKIKKNQEQQASNEDQGTGLSASYLKYMQERNPKAHSSQSSFESLNGSILSKYLRKSFQTPAVIPSDPLKGLISNSNKFIVSRKTHFGFTNQEYILTLDETYLSILPILNSRNSHVESDMELINVSNILSCNLHKSNYVRLIVYSSGLRKKKIYRFKVSTTTEAVELVNRIQRIQEKVSSTKKE